MELDYLKLENEAISLIESRNKMVLATSLANKTTARLMSIINIGLNIYFQTHKNMEKFNQIQNNHLVALCIDNIQIEGTASILGHPLDSQNKKTADLYQKVHPFPYQYYSSLKDEVLIQVQPSKIAIWKYENQKPYRDILDIASKKAYRIMDDPNSLSGSIHG